MSNIPNDYVLLSRVEFDEFSTKAFEGAIRGIPVKDRRSIGVLTALVSQSTHDLYIKALVTRMNGYGYTEPNLLTNPTYAGMIIEVEDEIPNGMIEIYGPFNEGVSLINAR